MNLPVHRARVGWVQVYDGDGVAPLEAAPAPDRCDYDTLRREARRIMQQTLPNDTLACNVRNLLTRVLAREACVREFDELVSNLHVVIRTNLMTDAHVLVLAQAIEAGAWLRAREAVWRP